jgi:hypothetical protein
MTIISELNAARALNDARTRPGLDFLPFSSADLLIAIQGELFADIPHDVRIHFVARGPLACITDQETRADIYIHQLLNHSATPSEVIRLIIVHELLHLRIPPVDVQDRVLQHPPQFRAAERELLPDRRDAWAWIWGNLWSCLKIRRRLEQIDVLSNWKSVWGAPKQDVQTCLNLATVSGDNPERSPVPDSLSSGSRAIGAIGRQIERAGTTVDPRQ